MELIRVYVLERDNSIITIWGEVRKFDMDNWWSIGIVIGRRKKKVLGNTSPAGIVMFEY